ncbi:MAG: roadblock/LC7 domain-containing protein [Candidatus Lokiarchaeota archaeon]|nr:roadblock/LC7 domain-containing protein [Candidatus Lokiarchaeota archaeon]
MIEPLKNNAIIRELDKLDLVNGISGTAIVNRNGLILIPRLPRHIDNRKFGAMAATMFEAMETAVTTFNDNVVNLTVEFDEEQLVVYAINEDLIFTTLIEMNIDLGIILIEVEELIKFIQRFLEGE